MADHDGRISSDAGDSSRHQVVELDHDIIDNDLSGWQEDEVAGKTVRYDDEHGVEIGEIPRNSNNNFEIPYLRR